MVDHHLTGTTAGKHILHLVETTSAIEVETEHQIGLIESTLHLGRMLVVTQNGLTVGQPLQIVGHHVGHTYLCLLALREQKATPSQRRADGISVGRLMTTYHNMLRSRYHLLEGSGFL